jgi:formylglycine-generating enzyme required for sulfatase activity
MKAIPGGVFMMGCGLNDEPCEDFEWVNKKQQVRQRSVATNSFFMAETETTWALYQLCIDAGSCPDNTADGGDNAWGKDSRPVIEVSWNEITGAFLPWLQRRTSKNYRLPTEAEWEYAARAGSISRYAWGADIDCQRARFGYSSGDCGKLFRTDPVKMYAPNAFGLYDVHGNVWEFVADCWNGEPSPGSSTPDGVCQEFVLRGGSWLNDAHAVRSASRFRHDRRFRESGDGFRLALDGL